MTEDRLAEIRQRRAAITPPPWDRDEEVGQEYYGSFYLVGPAILGQSGATTDANPEADAEFIAHAPEDIDHLLGEVERLRGLLKRLEWACDDPDVGGRCPACGGTPPVKGFTYSHDPGCWLAAEL